MLGWHGLTGSDRRRGREMIALRIIQLFFVAIGSFGLGLWLKGSPFISESGPLIVQGFGCAAALEYGFRTIFRGRQ